MERSAPRSGVFAWERSHLATTVDAQIANVCKVRVNNTPYCRPSPYRRERCGRLRSCQMRVKAEYTLHLLAALVVYHIFGVPAYYNLRFLDYVMKYTRIAWTRVHWLTQLMKDAVTYG
jgi:hypothetical protein